MCFVSRRLRHFLFPRDSGQILADKLLDYVPSHRINDVVYFDPADESHPVAFNVMEALPPEDPNFTTEKTLVTSGLISVFKKIWGDFWGPRTEDIIRNTLLALLDTPGTTLLSVPRRQLLFPISDDHTSPSVVWLCSSESCLQVLRSA